MAELDCKCARLIRESVTLRVFCRGIGDNKGAVSMVGLSICHHSFLVLVVGEIRLDGKS